jgi:hypothetical protein
MRNKGILIAFILMCGLPSAFAQIDTSQMQRKSLFDVLLDTRQEFRARQMDSLCNIVQNDTTARKVVLFDSGFKAKYIHDEEFNYVRKDVSQTFLARLKAKLVQWINRLLGYGIDHTFSNTTALIIKILAGIILLVVLYFIVRFVMNHSGHWLFQKENESVPIDIHNTEQLIQSANFEQWIAEMEKQGDTRQSIRLYYLWLLKDLKGRELIKWLPEKTNADYLSELKGEALRKQFSYLSYLFSYIWYGEFSITDSDYLVAKKAFLTYLKKEVSHE